MSEKWSNYTEFIKSKSTWNMHAESIFDTLNWRESISNLYVQSWATKVNITSVSKEQKKLFQKIPWCEDIIIWDYILDLHRWETNELSEISHWFKIIYNKLLQAKQHGEKLPSHIIWLSNISFILSRYWFDIFDKLPEEVYTEAGQYKRLFGPTDANNPLTENELIELICEELDIPVEKSSSKLEEAKARLIDGRWNFEYVYFTESDQVSTFWLICYKVSRCYSGDHQKLPIICLSFIQLIS